MPLVSFSSSPAWQKPQRWPLSPGLARMGDLSLWKRWSKEKLHTAKRSILNKPQAERTNVFTWEEVSSSAACDEVERDSSDWPRGATFALPFSNLPLPLLWGGDASESLATPPSSSTSRKSNMMNFLVPQPSSRKQGRVNGEKVGGGYYLEGLLEKRPGVCDSKLYKSKREFTSAVSQQMAHT